jgi:5-methylcytosine-specific restriction enzyme subunit McrC
MRRTLRVFEHRKLHVAPDGIHAHEFDAIVQFNDRHEGQFFDIGHKHIKARHFVGYIEVGELSIEILPKADRNDPSGAEVWSSALLEMLRVALGLRLDQLPGASQKAARCRLVDLIAQAYVAEVEPLLREGLAKGYRATSANGTVFKGRLKIADHLRDNIAHADRFFVEFETFDQDILANRVLVAALDALSWCALSDGVARSVEACLSRFPELQHRSVTIESFDPIHLTRSTQRYANALTYARLILSHRGPQLRAGRERVFALLFDMNALWERYIAVLLRRVAPASIHVSTQERHVFWKPTHHGVRKIRPDIVLREALVEDAGKTLLVVDTKWKVPTNGLPSDDDLKQMFVYNELLSGARSMLLYPRTAKSFHSTGKYSNRDHTCEQRHIGLFAGAKWSTTAIKDQLRELLADLAT